MAGVAVLKLQIRPAASRPAFHSGPVGLAVSRSFPYSRVERYRSLSSTYHGERSRDFRARSGEIRLVEKAEERRRVCGGPVRCTAEGIGRGLFAGRKEGGFVAAERLKVVALVAAVMCLCNADRVVMSVAVVPLAAKHGWSNSFLGIVQVRPNVKYIRCSRNLLCSLLSISI